MGKYFLLLFIFLPVFSFAAKVNEITAETVSMPPKTLLERFEIKAGDEFNPQKIKRAEQKLNKYRVFRDLKTIYKEKNDGFDIHIKADDRTFVFPMLFSFNRGNHALGFSLESGNLFKKGEYANIFIGGGKHGFDTHGLFSVGNHTFSAGYLHYNFEQSFYENGWVSSHDIFNSVDDNGSYGSLLGQVNGKQDVLYFSYKYQFSSVWSALIKPEYEYYRYQNNILDTGNHSNITFGLEYVDDVNPSITMSVLNGMQRLYKKDMLTDLPHVRTGKMVNISYTAGGKLTGSDYNIQKISLGGNYLWELKNHNVIALFAKVQSAFSSPLSNQIYSSDLLFGMGIYDRDQRGKRGASAGIGITYFLLRNKTGLLVLIPFYEQAFITSGGGSYQQHSGVGATIGYRWWRVPVPISFNFTHNISDGSHHISCKIGGHF